MRILLDTQAFLWMTMDDPGLSEVARKVVEDGGNSLYLSAASGWEIAIKSKIGKLRLSEEPEKFLSKYLTLYNINTLPITLSHALHTFHLPELHKDPFDRMLVAQAQWEGLSILTSDSLISNYEVSVIW